MNLERGSPVQGQPARVKPGMRLVRFQLPPLTPAKEVEFVPLQWKTRLLTLVMSKEADHAARAKHAALVHETDISHIRGLKRVAVAGS